MDRVKSQYAMALETKPAMFQFVIAIPSCAPRESQTLEAILPFLPFCGYTSYRDVTTPRIFERPGLRVLLRLLLQCLGRSKADHKWLYSHRKSPHYLSMFPHYLIKPIRHLFHPRPKWLFVWRTFHLLSTMKRHQPPSTNCENCRKWVWNHMICPFMWSAFDKNQGRKRY